jgi:hypothetical protein
MDSKILTELGFDLRFMKLSSIFKKTFKYFRKLFVDRLYLPIFALPKRGNSKVLNPIS